MKTILMLLLLVFATTLSYAGTLREDISKTCDSSTLLAKTIMSARPNERRFGRYYEKFRRR